MTTHHFALTPLAAALAWALIGTSVQAQTTAAPEAADAVKKTTLETVVVTAERRVSNIQKTAISIAAITGEDMRAKGLNTLENVLSDTPAVQVMGSPQGGQVFVRGVGSQGDSNWVDPAVSLNLDGVYSGRAERVLSSMYDISRVEVLRGPQGTLYGRNATGGSVNVLSNNPGNTFAAGVNAQVGSYELRHLDGYLNVPINDMLSVRAAALRETRDGYFSNGGRASDLTAGRIKVLLKPTHDFSLLATVDSLESKGAGMTTVPRHFEGGPPFFNWRTDYSDPWQVDSLHPADTQRTRFNTVSLQADWDLGFGLLTLLPARTTSNRYVETDLVAGIAAPGSSLPLPASTWEESQKTLEVRLSSPAASQTKWVLGAYAFSSDNTQTGIPPSFPPPTWQSVGVTVPANSRAVFGQLTFPLSDTLRLTSGLRYTRDRKTYHYSVTSTSVSPISYDSGPQTAEDSYSSTTYKLGLEADLSPQSLLYAQIASGYKAGGFGIAVPPQRYAPEHLTAIELGSKNRFLDNSLQINGELFHYNYKNYQVQYADTAAPSPIPGDSTASFQQYVVNAGKGRISGFDVESRLRVAGDTELRAAVTYTDAHYGDFALAALQSMNGGRVVGTPKWTFSLGLEQGWELLGGQLTAGAQIKFSDGYPVSLDSTIPGGTFNSQQAKFHRTDLRLAYSPASDRWSLSLWAKNLENDAQTTQVLPFGRTQITDPRTVGLNMSYKF